METKEGVITDTDQKLLSENGSGAVLKYVNPANVVVTVNDKVIFIQITTGNGQTINVIKERKV